MIVACLSLALFAFAPPALEAGTPGVANTMDPNVKSAAVEDKVDSVQLVLGPGLAGRAEVLDAQGASVAQVELSAGDRRVLTLAPGSYGLRWLGASESAEVHPIELEAGQAPHTMTGDLPVPKGERATPAPAARARGRVAAPSAARSAGPASEFSSPAVYKGRRARAAASVVVPGLGQMLLGHPKKGAGILIGTLGLLAATSFSAQRPPPGASLGRIGEGARLAGYGLSTGALMMMWSGQVIDAFQTARGRPPRPLAAYKIRVELNRTFSLTQGVRPGGLSYVRDWSLSLMGQPARRVFVGASDISVHSDRKAGGSTRGAQLGLRAGYRVLEHKRVWLNVAGGLLSQVSWRPNPRYGRPGTGAQSRNEVDASLSPYVQLETRMFFSDRWSLSLAPRFYVPVGTRRFGRGGAVPSGAPSFELGTGVGGQF